jgi:hypothetical protein
MSGLKPFSLDEGFETTDRSAVRIENDLGQWRHAEGDVCTFGPVNNNISAFLEIFFITYG